jgi:Icc-related predicted phosphoesterase
VRALLLSDTHGAGRVADAIAAAAPLDIVLCAGDFTHFGRGGEPLFEAAAAVGARLCFSSGNHETRRLCEGFAATYGASYVDYRAADAAGLRVLGVAGCDLFSPARPRHIRDLHDALLGLGAGLPFAPAEAAPFTILLTHVPPAPWDYAGLERGSPDVARLLARHPCDLVVAGHFHEPGPRRGATAAGGLVWNPGPVGLLVEIDLAGRHICPLP